MFTGILFMLAWTLFDDGFNARIYAVIVPLAVTLKFVATGVGLLKVRAENWLVVGFLIRWDSHNSY